MLTRVYAIAVLLAGIGLASIGPAQAQDSLRERKQAVVADQAALQKQIANLQKGIDNSKLAQQDIGKSLRASETKISTISKTLYELQQREQALDGSLAKLHASEQQQKQLLKEQRAALAKQLELQYASGLSSWSTVLSGNDPQEISRKLSYLTYILDARVQALNKVNQTITSLNDLASKIAAGKSDLQRLALDTANAKEKLEQQRQQHSLALAKIELELKDQKKQAAQLQAQDQLLKELLLGLDKEIKLADDRRKAREAQAKSAQEPVKVQPVLSEPVGGFPGLQKGLLVPVTDATTQGRFGTQRPDGGIWRGVVLRTAIGKEVKSVADGKVVFADWLSGFGNILIIDHGKKYLSIYGYNQSLLKQVGDLVARGETIAQVGATGGQVEPGLYFELRHDGAPINPQLWLKH